MRQRHPDRAGMLSTSPSTISRNEACTVVSVVPYMLIRRGDPGGCPPRPKTLRFQRFTGEHHRLKLELTSQLGLQRIGGLQRIKRRGGLA